MTAMTEEQERIIEEAGLCTLDGINKWLGERFIHTVAHLKELNSADIRDILAGLLKMRKNIAWFEGELLKELREWVDSPEWQCNDDTFEA